MSVSRRGRTTKVHAWLDAQVDPLQIILTPGNIHDSAGAQALLSTFAAGALLADKAYDINAIVEYIETSVPNRYSASAE
ncbi:MAG: transposase [Myxococcales bacterium]|nr:transposase [Myxococcales bacterium]